MRRSYCILLLAAFATCQSNDNIHSDVGVVGPPVLSTARALTNNLVNSTKTVHGSPGPHVTTVDITEIPTVRPSIPSQGFPATKAHEFYTSKCVNLSTSQVASETTNLFVVNASSSPSTSPAPNGLLESSKLGIGIGIGVSALLLTFISSLLLIIRKRRSLTPDQIEDPLQKENVPIHDGQKCCSHNCEDSAQP